MCNDSTFFSYPLMHARSKESLFLTEYTYHSMFRNQTVRIGGSSVYLLFLRHFVTLKIMVCQICFDTFNAHIWKFEREKKFKNSLKIRLILFVLCLFVNLNWPWLVSILLAFVSEINIWLIYLKCQAENNGNKRFLK